DHTPGAAGRRRPGRPPDHPRSGDGPDPQPGLRGAMPSSEATQIKIIYVLYLAGFVVGITPIVGLVMAYMARGEAPPWLDTHYRYVIRTFWIGLLYGFIATALTMILIGFVLYLALAVWFIVRCVKGLLAADKGQPIDNVETWVV